MIHMYQLNCGSKYLIIKAESGTQKFLVSKSESIKYVWPGPGYIYLDHRYTELQPAWCPSLDGGFWKHSLADSWPSLHPVPPVPSQWWCPGYLQERVWYYHCYRTLPLSYQSIFIRHKSSPCRRGRCFVRKLLKFFFLFFLKVMHTISCFKITCSFLLNKQPRQTFGKIGGELF